MLPKNRKLCYDLNIAYGVKGLNMKAMSSLSSQGFMVFVLSLSQEGKGTGGLEPFGKITKL